MLRIAVMMAEKPKKIHIRRLLSHEHKLHQHHIHHRTGGDREERVASPQVERGGNCHADELRDAARRIFAALDGRGLSRVDFFMRKSDNAIIFNEINTLPGFTSISMYPKLFGAVGVDYDSLVDRLIELALAEHA